MSIIKIADIILNMEDTAEVIVPNQDQPVEVGKQSKVSRLVQETGIDIKYGEKTWRPIQSVIDLVQNHLDANTTVYEKRILNLCGIKDYDPSSNDQQEVVVLLNKIKYASEPKDIDKAYSMLMGILGQNTPPRESLQQQLQEFTYPLPKIRLKVTNGTESKLVAYEEVKDLALQWQVAGFRIDDSGSGFDHRLLGMMGASTKKESTGKRGGLGEGLKMSVTHLVRSGATVRLLSRNEDQLWIARPKAQNGSVVFEGKGRAGADPTVTGSLTDVDFASSNFDPKLRTEIIDAIDPRRGEGLGKYILEFRGPQFAALINSSTEISSMDVAGGRVYVKGLLVEESDNLLWSYNLKEKWAISGRDRKTVQSDALRRNVRGVIEVLYNPEQIEALVSILAINNNYLETQVLDGNLKLDDSQKELWKQAIEKTFGFTAGKQLFTSTPLFSQYIRLVRERGFEIITLPPESMYAIELFKKIYPGKIVSFDQFQESRMESSQYMLGRFEISDEPVSPETAEMLNRFKDQFVDMLKSGDLSKFTNRDRVNIPFREIRLGGLSFSQANLGTRLEGDSPFEYNAAKMKLYVREDAINSDFATLADMYVQLLKVVTTGKDTFDVESQALLTQMAAKAIASLRPELLTEFKLSGSTIESVPQRPISYTSLQREKDDQLVEFRKRLEVVNKPNITREELEAVLVEMRTIKPTNLNDEGQNDANLLKNIPSFGHQINGLFYFDGKVYSLNLSSLELQEIKPGDEIRSADKLKPSFTKNMYGLGKIGTMFPPEIYYPKIPKITPIEYLKKEQFNFFLSDGGEPGRRLLNPDESDFQLKASEFGYLPFQLNNGGSMRLSFTQGEKKAQIVIKRRGNKVIATKFVDGKAEGILTRGQSAHLFEESGSEVKVFNNVISIFSDNNGALTIDRNEFSKPKAHLEEINRGKEFVSSNITLDYGGEVWRDPKRILLDAIQNHIDAYRDQAPNISFTVAGSDGKVLTVSKEELLDLGNGWNIVGVGISDQGEGYSTQYLTQLGKSTKGDNDLGKFGEGLKMLAASALRQGIEVKISSRDWIATPVGHQKSVKDYETGKDRTFNLLGYRMEWQDGSKTGSQTKFSLLPLEPGQNQLTPDQMIKLQTILGQNSPSGKTWQEWTDVLDFRKVDQYGQRGLERYVLPKEEQVDTNGVVNLLMNRPGSIYEKGLLIPGEISKPMIFGFNIDETIIDTRERNVFNQTILEGYLSDYFHNLTDTNVMRKVLEMAKQNPNLDFYEYKFLNYDFNKNTPLTNVLWRQTYYEVFGDDAILSLSPRLEKLKRDSYLKSTSESSDEINYTVNDTSRFTEGVNESFGRIEGYRDRENIVGIVGAVANEVHLENQNLQILPSSLTDFFRYSVYTSQDFSNELKDTEVELSPQEKEKLVAFVQTANQVILTILESMDSSNQKQQYLQKIVDKDKLQARKDHLQKMPGDNIRIKHPLFPADGMVEERDGQAIVYFNKKILSDPGLLLETYVHEVTHYLSGQADYVLGFQRFLMALALNKTIY